MSGPGILSTPPLDYMPGGLVVRVKPDVIREAIGAAAMNFSRGVAAMLPASVVEPLGYLSRNLGLKETTPIFSRRGPELSRTALPLAQKNKLALISSVVHAAAPSLSGIAVLKVDPKAAVAPALRLLASNKVFEYIEPVPARYIGGSPAADPTPPLPPLEQRQWGLRAIRWFQAKRPDATELRIAVLDTGVDSSHPDLKDTVGAYKYARLKREDIVGHGTHVSGLLAAAAQSASGVTGIAHCKVDIWKIFRDQPEDDGRHYVDHAVYLRSLRAVLKSKAKVVNLSISGVKPGITEQLIIGEIVESGAVVACAMGNAYETGNPTCYPAAYDGVFAVGAIGADMRRGSFSNTGKHILISAPGVKVLSTLPRKTSISRSETDYAEWDGTSMAAPHIAGAAALYFSKFPEAASDDFRKSLIASAQRLSTMKKKAWTEELGYGVLNLEGVLTG